MVLVILNLPHSTMLRKLSPIIGREFVGSFPFYFSVSDIFFVLEQALQVPLRFSLASLLLHSRVLLTYLSFEFLHCRLLTLVQRDFTSGSRRSMSRALGSSAYKQKRHTWFSFPLTENYDKTQSRRGMSV